MNLRECINPLILKKVYGDSNVEVKGIKINSQEVTEGDLFIALRGYKVDGHQFVDQAVKNGAIAVLLEEPMELSILTIVVPDTQWAMAKIANIFFNNPTRELKLIGVTGTNGKTTTTSVIEEILRNSGKKSGLVGTMHMKVASSEYPVKNTTPDALELQKSFRLMRDKACEYAVAEISSHALKLGRTYGCTFHTAVFTNLSQDHLDFHGTMEDYRISKGLLFSQLSIDQYAVLNADDPSFSYYASITSAQVVCYGIHNKADVWAEDIVVTSNGTSFTLYTFKGSIEIFLNLIGKFNIYNVLAAATSTLLEGVTLKQIKEALENIKGIMGRFEPINEGQPFTVIVDYAHTPDSLENVLTTIQEFAQGKVFCVVGCGGDRDKHKRPIMAKVAIKHSDFTLFTSDNPRTEDPNMILLDMLEGIDKGCSAYVSMIDRKEAITSAIQQAKENDVILIAGKGHETYQEINGIKYDFDDREVARMAIQKMRLDNNGKKL